MIALFTDFTLNGPYVGQLHAVLAQLAPQVRVLDLMHDAPRCDPRAASCLLPRILDVLPETALVVAVVDPGVGDPARRPVILEADGRCLVGPDNGLLSRVAQAARETRWWHITWRPPRLSDSFHGRDLFAPVAAHLANGTPPAELAEPLHAPLHAQVPVDLYEVVYVDAFGNLVTGITAGALSDAARLAIGNQAIGHARTFSDVAEGALMWYRNSMGLVEIAQNRASAAATLDCAIGTPLRVLDN